jgi:hypothetical protein
MKPRPLFAACTLLGAVLLAQSPAPTPPPAKLTSDVYDWASLVATPNAKGLATSVSRSRGSTGAGRSWR